MGSPRIHGEKLLLGTKVSLELGSPPHTRGKVESIHHVHADIGITPAYTGKRPGQTSRQTLKRITPAYTGKSVILNSKINLCQDHPRIHGEKTMDNKSGKVYGGSPPHTRGKVIFCKRCLILVRITPAYTGKRRCRNS